MDARAARESSDTPSPRHTNASHPVLHDSNALRFAHATRGAGASARTADAAPSDGTGTGTDAGVIPVAERGRLTCFDTFHCANSASLSPSLGRTAASST